jgi:predicted secreted protein
VKIIQQKISLLLSGTVILIAVFGAGCLISEKNQISEVPAQCSESLITGQNMAINETQNNTTICATVNSSVTMRLTDWSRTGGKWIVSATPDLRISDKGIIWYDEKGMPTNIPGLGKGIHTWEVTMNSTGVQKIHAVVTFPGRGSSGPEQTFDVTIIVE